MSAICGIFNTDSITVSSEISGKMMDKLKIYPFDHTGTWEQEEVFLGCGLQRITPESLGEVLPEYDADKQLSITADAIIDNREELFTKLNISKELGRETTDSDLILMAFDKWGIDCPKYLVGDFAFAIWDEKKKELFCARDHTGTRTFYYYYKANIFAFCTIMKPLFEVFKTEIELNERWITDFLALEGINQEYDYHETIYKDIFQLEPGHYAIINSNQLKKNQYWDPLNDIKQLNLTSDYEYEEKFRRVFSEAIRCRLRSIGEVGIMLSGGLDSGSTASIAAPILGESNKKLNAFSSIPCSYFVDYKPSKYLITNETQEITELCNCVGNINATYCAFDEKNSASDINRYINILEQPYKMVHNLFWYGGIIEKAKAQNCKILLNGQSGNSTISQGEFLIYTLTLYKEKKFIELYREINAFASIRNFGRKRVTKEVFKRFIPYKLREIIGKYKTPNYDRFANEPVKRDLIKKWNVEKRFNNKFFNPITPKYYDYYEQKYFACDPLAFSHIGAIETKLGLANNLLIRDATRDKRVIEFCLSMPSNQFVRGGNERYLIRRAMKGILPDKIRLNVSTRGRQSADWVQRLEKDWNSIEDEILCGVEDDNVRKYIDCDKIINEINNLKNGLSIENDKIFMLMITLIFIRFIKNYFKVNNQIYKEI